MIISHDEKERAVFRSRRMAETDRLSDLATARDKGIAQGRAESLMEVACNARKIGISVDDIVKLTGLPREKVERIPH